MPRNFRLYLAEIMQCCERAIEYTDGHTVESFSDDQKSVDAVARNLGIIGEAVKNLPPELFPLRPEVNWSDVAKIHEKIVHQYFSVKPKYVWDTVHKKIEGIDIAATNLYLAFRPDDE